MGRPMRRPFVTISQYRMAPDSTQKKLNRVRLSLQVSYNLQVGDLIELPELPFALDGDSGFIQLTPSNIQSVLQNIQPPSGSGDKKKK